MNHPSNATTLPPPPACPQERYLDELAAGGSRHALLADDGLGFAGGFGAGMDAGYGGLGGYGYGEEAALGEAEGEGLGGGNAFTRSLQAQVAAHRAATSESEEEFDVETERCACVWGRRLRRGPAGPAAADRPAQRHHSHTLPPPAQLSIHSCRLRAALNGTQDLGSEPFLGLTPASAGLGGAAGRRGGRGSSSVLRRDSEAGAMSEK